MRTRALTRLIFLLALVAVSACANRPSPVTRTATAIIQETPTRVATATRAATPTVLALPTATVAVTDTVTPARPTPPEKSSVVVSARATKIAQIVGETDKERQQPTLNRTFTRYKLAGTDLGVPFRHKDRIYSLFGDTIGAKGGDAIAYMTDATPEDGVELTFIADASGTYQPVKIPGISQGGFEVPMEGVSVGGRMYIYHTTDSPGQGKMGRSIVAVSDDDGKSFAYLYDLSKEHFINVSVVQVDAANWKGLPQDKGAGLVMFGSGEYRQSNVRLAFQPEDQIGSRASIRYFAGWDRSNQPIWSAQEKEAQPLFDQPCVGELSVSYNQFIRKWIMLYNCMLPRWRGINLRTADQPWGPWSDPQIVFHPWDDNGYCHFMHMSWQQQKCDDVSDATRENETGGEYGPYQYEDWAIGADSTTTIYFNLSTWNPYTVVLMKATLSLKK